MKQGWEIKKLGEVCEIKTGKKDVNQGNPDGNYPFFTCAREHTFSDTFSFDTEALLIAGNGDVGNVSYYKGKFEAYQRTYVLFDFKGIQPRFLFRVLDGTLKQVMAQSKLGNTMPYIKLGMLKEFEIPLPPLPEQQRIVSILDEAFAAIAKAKANAEQNLQNAKELFESYLNSIKADKVDLGSLVDIKTGKLNSNAAVENGIYPFFTCSREVYAIDNYSFDLEAILLAGNNASGDFNVKHYKGKFNAYQRTYVITVNEKQKILYRYLYFQLLKSLKEFKEMSVGANTRFLKLGMIQGLKIALPTIEEQQTIVRQLDALRAETQKLEAVYHKKLQDLEELKKSILQKAFNGEL